MPNSSSANAAVTTRATAQSCVHAPSSGNAAATSQKAIKSTAKSQKVKKKPYRPRIAAMKEIRRYQKSTQLLIRRLPFQRLERELTSNFGQAFKYTSDAMSAIQVKLKC